MTIAQYSELSARITALEQAIAELQAQVSALGALTSQLVPKTGTLHVRKKAESRRAVL